MFNLTAGIVLYNPDITRLNENIKTIINQVSNLILVDNGSENIEVIKKIYNNKNNILIIENHCNMGIAYALNQIMSEAKKNQSAWCLLLDQDTVCSKDLIELYLPYTKMNKIAIITPVVVDRNKKLEKVHFSKEYNFIDKCITSASLNSVNIWNEIGGFDNNLFIDAVDHDYCIRTKKQGYNILKINSAVILHEIGKITVRRFLLWRIDIYNHSIFRKYYISRNIIYVDKKNSGKLHLKSYLRVLKQALLVIFYEEDKISKLSALYKGTIDGMNETRKLGVSNEFR